ncbi:hypothetical protein DFP73DRAFT_568278 [Morchella snyderi]|nr:hypothetical protein DFP73DRAFT_568278 [Morchella snyderi]
MAEPMIQATLNPMTLRVSGIPAIMSGDEFIENLEKYLALKYPRESEENYIDRWSFAPSAISADRDRLCVATITFDQPLEAFRHVQYLSINLQGNSYRLSLDSDFEGLTPLHHPSGQPKVDIIALTGFCGHAFRSWEFADRTGMFLRDSLPYGNPGARIMTFGYDPSPPSDGETKLDWLEVAQRFLEVLIASRAKEDEKQRPIIFLGHNWGGILIKRALCMAAQGRVAEEERSLYLSCYGLFFFGVPHRGLNAETLRDVFKGEEGRKMIHEVSLDSTLLLLLQDDFRYYFRHPDSVIISAYETVSMKTFVETEDGCWVKTGPPALMVARYSATDALPTENRYNHIPLDADNKHLIKFKNGFNTSCSIIRQRICYLSEEAPKVIRKRFNVEKERGLQLQSGVASQIYTTHDSTSPPEFPSKNLDDIPR